MARLLSLATRAWLDRTLDEVARKAAEWGYQALELPCDAEHAGGPGLLADAAAGTRVLGLLEKHELKLSALSCHTIGQLLGDRLDERHSRSVPAAIWGDGDETGVRARAREAAMAAIGLAQSLQVGLLVFHSGSPLTGSLFGSPPVLREQVRAAYRAFGEQWRPLLEAAAAASVRIALEVQPGQMAFDLPTAEAALKAVGGDDAFGFALNPGALHWQGLDPVEFVRAFPERLFHVCLKDAAVHLNGRTSILNSHLPSGDPRRGWDHRAPGLGGVDWPSLFRALNDAAYAGPLVADHLDPGLDRDVGAAEAATFARRIDLEPPATFGAGYDDAE